MSTEQDKEKPKAERNSKELKQDTEYVSPTKFAIPVIILQSHEERNIAVH